MRKFSHCRPLTLISLMTALLTLALIWTPVGASTAKASHASSASFLWTTPLRIDGNSFGLTSVSCPSELFCAAVDYAGNILTSTDPSGGDAAWTTTPVGTPIDTSNGAYVPGPIISCPSASFCVASFPDTDGFPTGQIFVSSDPTGGASAWSAVVIPGDTNGFEALSCESTNFCIGVDGQGDIFTSTDPASAWNLSVVQLSDVSLPAVSCPSVSLCVLVSSGPLIFTPVFTGYVSGSEITILENPLGTSTETTVPLPSTYQTSWSALSCPYTTLCVAEIGGNLYTSTNPTGGASSWTASAASESDYGWVAVSCASITFCAASDLPPPTSTSPSFPQEGNLFTSDDPEDSSGWLTLLSDVNGISTVPGDTTSAIDKGELIDSISCPSALFCAAVDEDGNFLTGSTLNLTAPFPAVQLGSPKQYWYALGDSYISGEGAFSYYSPTESGSDYCHRSPDSYAALLHVSYEHFFACSGATIEDMVKTFQTEAPQISRLSDSARIILLSAGGDSLGFVNVLDKCVSLAIFHSETHGDCTGAITNAEKLIPSVLTQLISLMETIHSEAPNAWIILVGYPRLFPVDPSSDCTSVSVANQVSLNAASVIVNDQLSRTAVSLAQKLGVPAYFANTTNAFSGHQLCNPATLSLFGAMTAMNPLIADPTTLADLYVGLGIPEDAFGCHPVPGPGICVESFHPTAYGYIQLANFVSASLNQLEKDPPTNPLSSSS